MKEVIVSPLPTITTTIHDVPIPTPAPNELLIKAIAVASNPKDWSHLTALKIAVNSGDDVAGIVEDMGEEAAATGEFRKGDRVAGFHRMLQPHGTYAEYCVVPYHTAFIIPKNIGFEEASTIPLVTLTAATSLFRRQGLPAPWMRRSPSEAPLPLIVYGASSALGCYAIKLAKAANIHPIIAIAGGSKDYVASLLEPAQGDALVDYRSGIDEMKDGVRQALGGLKAEHAIDTISSTGAWVPLSQLVDPEHGQVTVVSGANKYDEPDIPEAVQIKYTFVGAAHGDEYRPTMPKQPEDKESVRGDVDFAYVLMRYVARLLARGDFSGHPVEVIPGGLEGVETGLRNLKDGKAKSVKYVYRVAEVDR